MWRLVEIGEVIENGDEYWQFGEWIKWPIGSTPTVKYVGDPVRRWAGEKKSAVPAISVGDRVEVISGTWAKSCGTVLGILPMNLKIKLENVFVGGKPLTIRVSPSDVAALKSAPKASVHSDPEWRMLETGEVIREGDEIYFGKWEPCVRSIVALKLRQDDASLVRRRVRLQSPGWRYLDAGETVLSGDEYASCRWRWDIQQKSTGRVVSSSESFHFRRKTAPFAG